MISTPTRTTTATVPATTTIAITVTTARRKLCPYVKPSCSVSSLSCCCCCRWKAATPVLHLGNPQLPTLAAWHICSSVIWAKKRPCPTSIPCHPPTFSEAQQCWDGGRGLCWIGGMGDTSTALLLV